MGITVRVSGNFSKTEKFLMAIRQRKYTAILNKYGSKGVSLLQAATPTRTGRTANSWNYEVKKSIGSCIIHWTNSNVNEGRHIALLIQYGHGTGTGGYVPGYDYINPSIKPLFDTLASDLDKELRAL